MRQQQLQEIVSQFSTEVFSFPSEALMKVLRLQVTYAEAVDSGLGASMKRVLRSSGELRNLPPVLVTLLQKLLRCWKAQREASQEQAIMREQQLQQILRQFSSEVFSVRFEALMKVLRVEVTYVEAANSGLGASMRRLLKNEDERRNVPQPVITLLKKLFERWRAQKEMSERASVAS